MIAGDGMMQPEIILRASSIKRHPDLMVVLTWKHIILL